MRSEAVPTEEIDRIQSGNLENQSTVNKLKWRKVGRNALFFKKLEESIIMLAGALSKEMKKTEKQIQQLKKMNYA